MSGLRSLARDLVNRGILGEAREESAVDRHLNHRGQVDHALKEFGLHPTHEDQKGNTHYTPSSSKRASLSGQELSRHLMDKKLYSNPKYADVGPNSHRTFNAPPRALGGHRLHVTSDSDDRILHATHETGS